MIRNSKGQDVLEYALLAALLATCAVGVLPGGANTISKVVAQAQAVLGAAGAELNSSGAAQ